VKYLSVLNWNEYQARTDKELPWLKLWGKLFTRIWWQELKDSEKIIPIIMLDVARRMNNRLPRDPDYYLRNYNLKLSSKAFTLVCNSLYTNGFLSDCLDGLLSQTTIILSPSPSLSLLERESERKPFGEHNLVKLTEKEFSKLVARFGQAGAEAKISRLENYIGSKGDKYESHYHTILNWANKKADESKTDDGLTKAQRATLRGLEELNASRDTKQSDHASNGIVSGDSF
jgi:hypothetical protein